MAKGDETRTHAARDVGTPGPLQRSDLPVVDPHHYQVSHEHARGGLGRVLAARDRLLDRPVAIKQLLAPGPEASARFMREAMLTARLQHPAIVPIYEAGRWPDGEPFYTMKLVAGRSLKDAIAAAETLDARLALLPHVITVAEAIAYAHSHEIVHRDLKPSNVVLGEFGETVVIDWGIAKQLGEAELGEVIGTPAYMAPEQARGDAASPQTDVYAIGAILYHLLARQAPYIGDDVIAEVLARPPHPIAEIEPAAPRELVGIVTRAMARAPADRHASARDLAEDLRRFQAGQLVASHHYTALQLLVRWYRRHRLPVILSVAFALALVLGGAFSVRRIGRERSAAEERRNHLVLLQARDVAERDPAAAVAWLKSYPIESEDFASVRAIFEEVRGRGATAVIPDVVGGAIAGTPDGGFRILRTGGSVLDLDPRTGAGHERSIGALPPIVICADFTRDGDLLAVADPAGFTLIDLVHGTRRRIALPAGEVLARDWCRFTSDGRAIGFGAGAGLGWLDIATGAIRVFHGPGTALEYAHADGGPIAWGGWPSHALHVVDLATGDSREWPGGDFAIIWMAYSYDGQRIVAMSREGRLYVWSHRGDRQRDIAVCPFAVTAGAMFPGDRLAVHCQDGRVRLVHLDDGSIEDVAMTGPNYGSVAARDDHVLISVGAGRGAISDLASGAATGFAYDDDAAAVRQSADRAYFALATEVSGKAMIFRTRLPSYRVTEGSAGNLTKAVFSPDGTIAIVRRDGLAICDRDAAACRRVGDARASWLAFSENGKRLGFANDQQAGWIDVATGEVHVAGAAAVGVAWSPIADRLAIGESARRLIIADADTGAVSVIEGAGLAYDLAWSRDGRRLTWRDDAGNVGALDLPTGKRWQFRGEAPEVALLGGLGFTTDGSRVLGGSSAGTLEIWNLDTGAHESFPHWHDVPIAVIAISPDGHTAATCSNDRRVRLIDLATRESRVLEGHTAEVWMLAFSPDGRRLASGARDGTVRVWDVATGDVHVLRGHAKEIRSVAFAPPGDRLISASEDRIIVWDLAREVPAPLADARAVRAALDAESSVVLGPDDRPLTR